MSVKKQTEELWVCRRYFNEHTAFVGELDWDEFYRLGRALDPVAEREMFAHVEKKKPLGKEAAKLIGRAKVAARRARGGAAAAAATTGGSTARKGVAGRTKRRKADSDVDMEGNSENSGDEPDTEDESFVPAEMPPPAKGLPARTASRTPVRATRGKAVPATKRRMRLQDLQRPASVTATILKRASKILTATGSTNSSSGKTIYETARQRLHVSAVPDTLPCREDEFAEIYGSLYNAIEERNSMCMYISGVPGTGKTATVYEVIRTLQENSEDGELSEFQYIELNGMKMTEPSQAYAQLWQAISGGEKATPRHAAQLLERHFSAPSPRRHTYVVLMDELDLLVTKSQSIMYNFFDWPHRPHAKLIVIAIANTMDLPERMLSHKVSSRLGLTRINFQPYTHLQLMTIVMSRLEGCLAFGSDAVELCARKISAVSGDARRALD
ncbi:Origin recognition complex, subunit 1, partial [Kickxella alabastrina]